MNKLGENLFKKTIDTNGELSVHDIVDCGFSEGVAVEAIMRMASRCVPASVMVRNAAQRLMEAGFTTYKGVNLSEYCN